MTNVIGEYVSQTMRELMHVALQRGGVVEIREHQVGEVAERFYRLSTCDCAQKPIQKVSTEKQTGKMGDD